MDFKIYGFRVYTYDCVDIVQMVLDVSNDAKTKWNCFIQLVCYARRNIRFALNISKNIFEKLALSVKEKYKTNNKLHSIRIRILRKYVTDVCAVGDNKQNVIKTRIRL